MINGILIVNKEEGYTSRDVVNIISKKLGTKKIGHTGTLDPLATGVLVLCVGSALKTVELITSFNKEYIARVVIGYETDTLDITGNVINEYKKDILRSEVETVLSSFIGKSIQEVPKYSAVKVNGKKLYEYARNNIDVELPKKNIEIFDLQLIGDIELIDKYYEFTVKCNVSKGTYIRSLIRDIGYKLGSYGTMKKLQRTKQGNFLLEDSFTLSDIENNNYRIVPLIEYLEYPQINVEEPLLTKIKNGMVLDKFFNEEMVLITNNNNPIAIYYNIDNKAKVFKML